MPRIEILWRVLECLQWDLEPPIWQHAQLLKIEKNVRGSIHEAEEWRVSRVLSICPITKEASAIDDEGF